MKALQRTKTNLRLRAAIRSRDDSLGSEEGFIDLVGGRRAYIWVGPLHGPWAALSDVRSVRSLTVWLTEALERVTGKKVVLR